MIASIKGEIISILDDSLVIEVGGVGLRVFVPVFVQARSLLAEKVILHTYLVVREDALTLYGFQTVQERDIFTLLLGVNGVGPKVALSILSTMSVDAVRNAALGEEADLFARVPGVGKKTAQKIVLHLQGRFDGQVAGIGVGLSLDADTEVLEGLIGLGYSVVEAQAALQSLPRDAPEDVETRLTLALKFFSR
jgi:holliday junction DNA helicase RuvA